MRIQIDKKKDEIIFIPEKPIDYFHCGLIHGKVSSTATVTANTDNPEQRLASLRIPLGTLTRKLIK